MKGSIHLEKEKKVNNIFKRIYLNCKKLFILKNKELIFKKYKLKV